jgi:predicted amidohydrolase YtcJ
MLRETGDFVKAPHHLMMWRLPAVCYRTMPTHADLIFLGGRVHTVNATNDVVPALAVGGGRVLATGGDAEMRALAGPGARIVDLRGRSLLPGFIDAHCHLPSIGMAVTSIDC